MRLYHFTRLGTAWAQILGKDNDCLRKNPASGEISAVGEGFVVTQPRPGISLTTNPRLLRTPNAGGDGRPWAPVRIELDGDVLASRGVKLERYLDEMHGITEDDAQQEVLVRQDELSIKGALVGVEINLSAHVHDEAAVSIEKAYDPSTDSMEDMTMEQKIAKYGPYETERVREFVAWCIAEGIPVAEVAEFSQPAGLRPEESRLLSGEQRLEPPACAPVKPAPVAGPEL